MTIDWTQIRECLQRTAGEAFRAVDPLVRGTKVDQLVSADSDHDIVSNIDQTAGAAIRSHLRHEVEKYALPPLAILDEQHGTLEPLVPQTEPVIGLVVDEFDGTRPGRVGMPTASICLAAFPLDEPHTLANVRCGVVHLLTREQFSFERTGTGALWRNGDPFTAVHRLTDLRQPTLGYEHCGGLPALTEMYLLPFTHAHRYGAPVIASSAYLCTRILVGKLDLYLHVLKRIRRAWPELVPLMDALHGSACGQYPWDLATTAPLLWEAGCRATRSDGSPLDDVVITDSRDENCQDFLAAASPSAHAWAVAYLGKQEERLLAKRRDVVDFLTRPDLWVRPPPDGEDADDVPDTVIADENTP